MALDKKERKKEEHYRSEERPAVGYKAPRKSSKPSIKPVSPKFENAWDNSVSNYQYHLNKKSSKESKYSNESGNLLSNFDKISSVKNNEGNYKGEVFFEDNSKQEEREDPNGWEHYDDSWYKEEASFDTQYQMEERNQAYEHFQSEERSVDAKPNKDSIIKNYSNMNDNVHYKIEDEAKGLKYSLEEENVNYKVDELNNGSQDIIRKAGFTSDNNFDKNSIVDNGIRHVRRYSDKRPNLGGLRLGLSNKSETDEERDNQENTRFDDDGKFKEIKHDNQSIGDIKFDSHSFEDDFEEIRLNPQADDNSVNEKLVEEFDQNNYDGYKSDMSDDSIKLDNLDLNSDESYHDWRNNLLSKHIKEDEEITIRYESSFGFQNGAKTLQFNENSNKSPKVDKEVVELNTFNEISEKFEQSNSLNELGKTNKVRELNSSCEFREEEGMQLDLQNGSEIKDRSELNNAPNDDWESAQLPITSDFHKNHPFFADVKAPSNILNDDNKVSNASCYSDDKTSHSSFYPENKGSNNTNSNKNAYSKNKVSTNSGRNDATFSSEKIAPNNENKNKGILYSDVKGSNNGNKNRDILHSGGKLIKNGSRNRDRLYSEDKISKHASKGNGRIISPIPGRTKDCKVGNDQETFDYERQKLQKVSKNINNVKKSEDQPSFRDRLKDTKTRGDALTNRGRDEEWDIYPSKNIKNSKEIHVDCTKKNERDVYHPKHTKVHQCSLNSKCENKKRGDYVLSNKHENRRINGKQPMDSYHQAKSENKIPLRGQRIPEKVQKEEYKIEKGEYISDKKSKSIESKLNRLSSQSRESLNLSPIVTRKTLDSKTPQTPGTQSKGKRKGGNGLVGKKHVCKSWDPESIEVLLKAVAKHGENWDRILEYHGENGIIDDKLKGRTRSSCRNKYVRTVIEPNAKLGESLNHKSNKVEEKELIKSKPVIKYHQSFVSKKGVDSSVIDKRVNHKNNGEKTHDSRTGQYSVSRRNTYDPSDKFNDGLSTSDSSLTGESDIEKIQSTSKSKLNYLKLDKPKLPDIKKHNKPNKPNKPNRQGSSSNYNDGLSTSSDSELGNEGSNKIRCPKVAINKYGYKMPASQNDKPVKSSNSLNHDDGLSSTSSDSLTDKIKQGSKQNLASGSKPMFSRSSKDGGKVIEGFKKENQKKGGVLRSEGFFVNGRNTKPNVLDQEAVTSSSDSGSPSRKKIKAGRSNNGKRQWYLSEVDALTKYMSKYGRQWADIKKADEAKGPKARLQRWDRAALFRKAKNEYTRRRNNKEDMGPYIIMKDLYVDNS